MAIILDKGEEVITALLNVGADPDILDNKDRDVAVVWMERLENRMLVELKKTGSFGAGIEAILRGGPQEKTRISETIS